MQRIDFTKLLGFDTLPADRRAADFTDPTIGARLGAKVGAVEPGPIANGIDFQDTTLGAKLGAKIGDPEDVN